VGQKKRDDTKAKATSAKVVPLWPASLRDDLPTGYLEQVARRVRANLTDLVATADTYNLDLATEFRIAAELLQQPSGTSHPLQIAESAGLSLINGTSGCWELVDQNGNRVGLIVTVDGRLALAPTSWTRREVLAAGGAALLAPFASLGATATTASEGSTSSPPDPEAAARLDYGMQHPGSVDMATAVHLHEQAQSLAKQYDLAASTSLLPVAGEYSCQVTFLRSQAPDGPVLRELQPLRRTWRRSWASWSGMHRNGGTMSLPSATTTKRSPPPTAPARRRRWRMRYCERATSRCTANKSLSQGCGWRSKRSRWPRRLGAMPSRALCSCTPARATPCSATAGNVRLPLGPPKPTSRQCRLPIPPLVSSPPTGSDGSRAPAISPSVTAQGRVDPGEHRPPPPGSSQVQGDHPRESGPRARPPTRR
jgi:hypothetical protein